MKRAAVLIGVGHVAGLPALHDAVAGARRMRDWMLAQHGVTPEHVEFIADEDGPVEVAAVLDAVERLCDPNAGIEQLLVYFAGHGLNVNYGEFWLLSRGLTRAAESVDLARSARLARQGCIPHVIFISDACRTAAIGVQQQLITGTPIFGLDVNQGVEKSVDQFFACTLGNPALEISSQDASSAGDFKALYTQALLSLLGGEDPKIIEAANDGETPEGVVRPWPLKDALPAKVGELLKRSGLHVTAFQTPDARISSDPRRSWIARLGLPPPGSTADLADLADAASGGEVHAGMTPGAGRGRLHRRHIQSPSDVPKQRPSAGRRVLAGGRSQQSLPVWVNSTLGSLLAGRKHAGRAPPLSVGAELMAQAERRSEEPELLPAEAHCGVQVLGASVERAICSEAHVEWLVEGQALRVEPPLDSAEQRVLLVLGDGSGVVLPLLPGFVARLSFEEGLWSGLAYDACADPLQPDAALAESCFRRRYLREFVAAAVERGVFQPDRRLLLALAAHVHEASLPDPMLLLYLAYALDDAGMMPQLRDLIGALHAAQAPLLFDAALLATVPGADEDALAAVPPGLPLMARGWFALSACGSTLAAELDPIARLRHPSLFSHFTADAVEALLQRLEPPRELHHA